MADEQDNEKKGNLHSNEEQNSPAFIKVRGTGNTLFLEFLGALFLGILSIMLLIALQRAEARYRKLLERLLEQR